MWDKLKEGWDDAVDGFNNAVEGVQRFAGEIFNSGQEGQAIQQAEDAVIQHLDTPTPDMISVSDKNQKAFNQIYDLAKANGGAKYPEIVAAQAMHETGWLSNPDSVYFRSGKTNPFGQTGDRGYGTLPREGYKDGWTIYPDLKTAVDDNIKLWHDVKNHPENYNAWDSRDEGLRAVLKDYSSDNDPANIKKGFTENKYRKGVNQILLDMGF